jgi:hypothetical protein
MIQWNGGGGRKYKWKIDQLGVDGLQRELNMYGAL